MIWKRGLLLLVVVTFSVTASFGVTQYVGSRLAKRRAGVARGDAAVVPPSGSYLVAYVIVSSRCAACRDERTTAAVRVLRDSLRRAHASDFAALSVVGVGLDRVSAGTEYLLTFGDSFDEIAVGGAWMNQLMMTLVWRNAFARAATPQVIVVQRHVEARRFPEDVTVGADSLVFAVGGRDSVVEWVNRGTPLGVRRSAL